MQERPRIVIGGIALGEAEPPHVLADIDVYFKRDIGKALALVDAVAAAGCRFLKAAVLSRPELCLRTEERVAYFDHRAGRMVEEPHHAVIARHFTPLGVIAEALQRGRARGLMPILSVYDAEGIAFALREGAAAIKIPSSNIVHELLIARAARTGLPLIVDTGRSTLAEIDRAVGWARDNGAGGRLLVEHSPAGPPAGPSAAHLRMLPFIRDRYGVPVGLSDHAVDAAMLPIAVALGASVIEKGLVDDAEEPDIDVGHALPVSALADAVRTCREAWDALGQAPRPEPAGARRALDRMGMVAARDLAAGERISEDTVDFAFPTLGIPAEHWSAVKGRRLEEAVKAGTPIAWDALESAPP